ncbi:MAG: hypothetical protein AAGH88_12075 [Planctomycetota bacterium]
MVGADTTAREGGDEVPINIKGLYHRVKKLWADGGCSDADYVKRFPNP